MELVYLRNKSFHRPTVLQFNQFQPTACWCIDSILSISCTFPTPFWYGPNKLFWFDVQNVSFVGINYSHLEEPLKLRLESNLEWLRQRPMSKHVILYLCCFSGNRKQGNEILKVVVLENNFMQEDSCLWIVNEERVFQFLKSRGNKEVAIISHDYGANWFDWILKLVNLLSIWHTSCYRLHSKNKLKFRSRLSRTLREPFPF